MIINVIDAPMGAGKTTSMINYINSHKDNKYIYITPYIKEVERISKECSFSYPIKYSEYTPKSVDLKNLLNKGYNIVTTHSMFHCFDDEIIDLCYSQGYILIMDEVTDVIRQYGMCKKDLEILLRNFVTLDDSGALQWTAKEETDKFQDEKRLCEMGCLALYSDVAMVWMFPVKIFNAFRESYILTYMFDAQIQKYYYDYYGLKYRYLYVKQDPYCITDEPQTYKFIHKYKKLVNIINDQKLNMIGDQAQALSKAWYQRNESNVLMKTLKKNLYNYFNNRMVLPLKNGSYAQSSSADNLWTTFADYKSALAGSGYTKGFIPSNARATNEYRSRSVVAYPINRYFNPVIKNFFVSKGIAIDEDAFALSEMLQFIWRSAIRDGNKITVYIPSSRMRGLFKKWLDKT